MSKEIIWSFVIVILVGLGWIGFNIESSIFEAYNGEIRGLKADSELYEIRLRECRRYNEFHDAVEKISLRSYDREDYNCYDHAKDLQQELRELDIESSVFVGQDRTHAWLGVWIETTEGNFMSPDNPYRILEVRDENAKVVCDAYDTVPGKDIIK